MAATASDFGALLRHWREARRFSQLDLALQADVSSKHVSFLETGRNRPSREMILRLTQAMDVPLRDRNALLNAASFAPAYRDARAPSTRPLSSRRRRRWRGFSRSRSRIPRSSSMPTGTSCVRIAVRRRSVVSCCRVRRASASMHWRFFSPPRDCSR
jgi:transcriptional regulator with XRE-family HTH domain